MDYGKLAYMKVEELSQRLSAPRFSAEKNSGAYASSSPRHSFGARAAFPLTTLSGAGAVTLVVKLTVRRDAAVEKGAIDLYADNKWASHQKITGGKGEETYILLCPVYVSGSLPLLLKPESAMPVTLTAVEVAALGEGVGLGRSERPWRADYAGGTAVAAMVLDAEISLATVTDGAIGAFKKVGNGYSMDFAAVAGGFCLAYFDDLNNFWGVRFDANLNETARCYLGEAGDDLSVAACGEQLIVARLSGKKLYLRTFDVSFGGGGSETETDVGVAAEKIQFVRHSNPPMLTVYSGGVTYLKIPATEYRSDGVYTYRSAITLTEVTA